MSSTAIQLICKALARLPHSCRYAAPGICYSKECGRPCNFKLNSATSPLVIQSTFVKAAWHIHVLMTESKSLLCFVLFRLDYLGSLHLQLVSLPNDTCALKTAELVQEMSAKQQRQPCPEQPIPARQQQKGGVASNL